MSRHPASDSQSIRRTSPVSPTAACTCCHAEAVQHRLGLPFRRLPCHFAGRTPPCSIAACLCRHSSDILAPLPYSSICRSSSILYKGCSSARSRTVALDICDRYECGMPITLRRHLQWKPLSRFCSVLRSHTVSRPYNSFGNTHAL